MPRPVLVIAMALVLFLMRVLLPGVALAQDATPEADASNATEPILRISDADLTSSELGLVGFIRAVYEPGSSQTVSAGDYPSLLWLESGTLAVEPGEGPALFIISDEGSGIADSVSAPLSAGSATPLLAGQALILPAGSTAQMRNDGEEPAVTMDLLPVADVVLQPAEGVNQRLLARQESTGPSSPFVVELGRSVLDPGERYQSGPNVADLVAVAIDQSQYPLVARNFLNRGITPVPIYVLTVTPLEDGVATPSP